MSSYDAYILLAMVLAPVAAAAIWHMTGHLFFKQPDPPLSFRGEPHFFREWWE